MSRDDDERESGETRMRSGTGERRALAVREVSGRRAGGVFETGDSRHLRGFGARDTARLEAAVAPVENDDERTAPPTVLPLPDDEESGEPDLRDVQRRLNALIEVQAALVKKLWPVRRMPNELAAIVDRLQKLEARPPAPDGCAELETSVVELKERVDATIGVKDDNGKLGKLRGRVALIWAGLGFVLVTAVGSIGVAISASNAAGVRDGRNEARLDQDRHDLDRLVDQVQQLWTFRFRAPGAPGAAP